MAVSLTNDDQSVIELDVSGKKQPKRILHFSDGILEEYETDDEVDASPAKEIVNPSTLNWLPFFWYYTINFGSKTLGVCDTVGEYLAYFFGITSPKYQYEIEEYKYLKKIAEEEEKEEMENSEADLKSWGSGNETPTTTIQPTPEKERY